MNQVMMGALAMAFAVAGLFFLRFWTDTRDRLFALFALAFLVMAVNRVGVAVTTGSGEGTNSLYWIRLLSFALILLAILDKNRSQKPPNP
jgi:hypothetical protein